MSCPCSASSSIWTSAPAVSRSTIVSQSRKSESSSIPPTSWSTSCTEIVLPVAAASWSRVETASRNEPCAPRAIRARAASGASMLLALAHAAQDGDELLQPRPLEDERLAARAHGREDAREVGRAEDEDEVGRGLLDQLQQRVPGLRRELVGLVDDVDLVAALDRLQHGALADLADVVDAALRGGVHLDHVERAAVRDRPRDRVVRVEVGVRPALGVQRLGEDPRHRRLAGPARAGEEVRLPHLVVLDRVAERAHDRLLADHVAEVERTVGAIEGGQSVSVPSGLNASDRAFTPQLRGTFRQ